MLELLKMSESLMGMGTVVMQVWAIVITLVLLLGIQED